MATKTKTMRKVLNIIRQRPRSAASHDEASPPLLQKRMRELSSSSWGNALQENDYNACFCVNFSSKKAKKLVTVLVGPEKRSFKVPPHFLDHMLVQGLLEKSLSQKEAENDIDEKENEHRALMCRKVSFPRDSKGIIHFDCDAILFEHILWLLKKDDPSLRQLNLDELMEFYT
ncbi:hypothetical protein O6H91_13G087200 [Diphasiastrum complanatum]|uniref:Uncharacterized protein n=2 Tax=Diphasiastrum complanatum TaxID=34168 RepID=A0ACC2BWV7_DIPCM|nr:hypothetical protein O6H91_13G086600 [Diphasiastrum complanatum]KAJ7534274.1 hypothetical protein O6H91_13G087200 [Diphasiastrum complanatum]